MKSVFSLFFGLMIATITSGQAVQANLLDTWKDSAIQGTYFFDNPYNEVWGLSLKGAEYAIIGTTIGTHFIDVTQPEDINEVYFVPGKAQGTHIIHRDYHDYNGFLYAVCAEGKSSLQIMDIRQLPDTVIMVYDDDNLIDRSHNIFIDSTNARLYSFGSIGTEFGSVAMSILDISDPYNPMYLKGYERLGGLNYTYVHDGYVRDHKAFLNCGNGLAIMDYEDVESPVQIALLPANAYLQSGYNHSGWATDDCGHYMLADETLGTDLKSVDLSEAPDIEVVDYFNDESGISSTIPHNLVVACDFLYVAYYHQGLQVFDISDPSSPQRVMYYDTSYEPTWNKFQGAWGVYPYLPSGNILLSDMQNGLFVFEGIDSNCSPYENLSECFETVNVDNIEIRKQSLEVFPNPARNHLNIKVTENKEKEGWKVQLIDAQGIEQLKIQGFLSADGELDIPLPQNIPDGFYVLKLQNSTLEFSKKVFICR